MITRQSKLERFNENVLSKYQLFNSIFITLPFDDIVNTGVLLPLFSDSCVKGFQNKLTPVEIVNRFFEKYSEYSSEKEKNDLLFKFIQYIERQVVLFDAVEEASFTLINNMNGRGTLRSLKEEVQSKHKMDELRDALNSFKTRIVLTAHPTQFYPGSVLGIITDLAIAIKENNISTIKKLMAQLGKTPFFKKEKPTPFDEAVSLLWYLENVFYHSTSSIVNYVKHNILNDKLTNHQIIQLGFWPGGDRDGNPFVTPETTLKVAERLKKTILKCY